VGDGDTPAISSAVGVAVLLAEHWDALDHDFRHHYGLDLEECCFGPDALGVRRLRTYISQLPPESSAIAREMGWSWDEQRELLATLVELGINQRRTKQSDPIFKWPRPSELLAAQAEEQKPALTVAGVRAALLGPQGG
jgi:hypothetical protein